MQAAACELLVSGADALLAEASRLEADSAAGAGKAASDAAGEKAGGQVEGKAAEGGAAPAGETPAPPAEVADPGTGLEHLEVRTVHLGAGRSAVTVPAGGRPR